LEIIVEFNLLFHAIALYLAVNLVFAPPGHINRIVEYSNL